VEKRFRREREWKCETKSGGGETRTEVAVEKGSREREVSLQCLVVAETKPLWRTFSVFFRREGRDMC
jgi:hypothetical protein